jgi:S-DNA-T family DNA segregation ATPase FtsK/SpoIIIE
MSTRARDWHLATDSVLGNAVTAGVGIAATTAAMDAAQMHPVAGAGFAGIGALTSLLSGGMDTPERVTANLARWSAAGAWMSWGMLDGKWGAILHSDPWSIPALGTLAAGSAIGASLGPWLRRRSQAPKGQPGGLVLGSAARENADWQQRILERGGIGFRGVVVESVTRWGNGLGEDVRVVLPKAGATVDQLRHQLPGLAADANLPHGCTIETIEPKGEGQRVVTLRVPTRMLDNLNEMHPLWDEQRSILDGVPIGIRPNGDIAEGPMREESWLVVGKKGAGKTTLLHGITATVGMCSDALVWHIDLNGGGMTQPWVDVWLDGRVERCPVDWSAPTIDEALRMTEVAVRIALHRKGAYRKRKKAHNTNLLPIGADLPEIVIMLDEGAEAMAAGGKGAVGQLAANLEKIQRIARNEAVNLVLSVLRGTGDLVPAAMTTQTGVGICMKVRQQKEIASVFEVAYELKMKPEHLIAKGAGWIGVDGDLPSRYQTWNILPDDMEQMALRIARQRPDLDEASAKVAGEDYATRYDRMRELFAEDAEIVEAPARVSTAAATSSSVTADWDTGFTATVTEVRPALPPAAADDILAEALRVMDAAGVDRMGREQLAAELTGGDEDALRRAMVNAGAGAPHSIRLADGTPARGWYRREVEAATAVTAA